MSTLTVTSETFDQEVLQAELPVLIDLWAPWCKPCHIIAPGVEQISEEFKDKLKVVKINVDDNPQIAQKYGVRGIPTLLVVKGALELDRIVGVVTTNEIRLRVAKFV